MKPKKIGVNPLYPRTMNPYSHLITALGQYWEVDFDCAKGGFVTGDARPAHSQGSELRAAPWVRRHSTHPAVIRRDVERRARVTLPGALSDRAARLGQLQVGGERGWRPGGGLTIAECGGEDL